MAPNGEGGGAATGSVVESVVGPNSGTFAWSAAGATSYDVNFGATNPPGRVIAGVTTPAYAPAGMTSGTAYFWQVVARNSAGSTAGPGWSFTTATAAPRPTPLS